MPTSRSCRLTSLEEMREVFRILSDPDDVAAADASRGRQRQHDALAEAGCATGTDRRAGGGEAESQQCDRRAPGRTIEDEVGIRTDDWGREVTFAFQWVHQLLGNEQAKTPLDAFLETLGRCRRTSTGLVRVLAVRRLSRSLPIRSSVDYCRRFSARPAELGGLDHIVDIARWRCALPKSRRAAEAEI